MASGMSSTVKTGSSQQDLMGELRAFLAGTSRSVKPNHPELTHNALNLLKTLPAARDAVLEYFCMVMDIAVSRYVGQLESNMGTQPAGPFPEEATIAEIHSVLCSFVTNNPEAWAPIISTWSLELLGELSSRYAGRGHVPISAGLGESLQLWMSCRATRTLMDITTQCLACLMNHDTEACINSLLDVSVKHSPHFDWVVAHVGSCFPRTVVTRVLSCGLKDFYAQGVERRSNSQDNPGSSSASSRSQPAFVPGHFDTKASKLNSVVGILGHLAGSHFGDIRTALVELFKWSMEEGEASTQSQRLATVPYLLHLASLAPMLLRALSGDALQTLCPAMLPRLAKLAPMWCTFFGGGTALQELVVHLALGCEQGGAQAFRLLLDAAGEEGGLSEEEREACRDTLELLLQEVGLMLRCSPGSQSSPPPLLGCIRRELSSLQPMLLSPDHFRAQATVRLIALMGQHSATVPSLAIAYLLANVSEDCHLGAVLAMCKATSATQPSLLADALEQELRSPENKDHSTLWKNLATLLRYEAVSKGVAVKAAKHCMGVIADAVYIGNSDAAQVLELALPAPTGIELSLKLTRATVTYFFLSLENVDDVERLAGARRAIRLLAKLCSRAAPARALALRELLDGALNQAQARLFGAVTTKSITPGTVMSMTEASLLKDNQKQGVSALLPQRHSTVFHAGIIGHGPRRTVSFCVPPAVQVSSNCQLLVDATKACCSTGGYSSEPLNAEAVAGMALLLVELISPDVMYNGLPWPDEEFSKVTVERDLHIRRTLDDKPVAWELLRLAAMERPALCYCSVILRAYAASVMGQWGCSPASRPPHLTRQTQQLLDVLALGQLLPPTLASSRHLLPHITPTQVVLILRDIWNYLRDHVPSPALFKRDDDTGVAWRENMPQDAQYTECLRLTMQSHLESLGGLYAQVFVKPQLGESFSLSLATNQS